MNTGSVCILAASHPTNFGFGFTRPPPDHRQHYVTLVQEAYDDVSFITPVTPTYESSWDNDCRISEDAHTVRFSERFRATISRRGDAVHWQCELDDYVTNFVLSVHDQPTVTVEHDLVQLPNNGITWSALQQALVNNFEDDDDVRAIAVAAMICCHATGEHRGVADAILPSSFRQLKCKLEYDSPIDDDIITVLADAMQYDHELYFDCGPGHCAAVTTNESVSKLRRIEKPSNGQPFEETATMLMPFLFT